MVLSPGRVPTGPASPQWEWCRGPAAVSGRSVSPEAEALLGTRAAGTCRVKDPLSHPRIDGLAGLGGRNNAQRMFCVGQPEIGDVCRPQPQLCGEPVLGDLSEDVLTQLVEVHR